MTNQIKNIAKQSLPFLRGADVMRAGIFGSYARGENHPDSDIDFLIQFAKQKTLFDVVRLKNQLEKTLGKEVDLLTYNSLSPYLKEDILREEQRIL